MTATLTTAALLDSLTAVLGTDGLKTGADIPVRNHADSSGLPPVAPAALMLPRTTEQVSAALALCHRHGQSVVTQGGLTGLVGGGRPDPGEFALSLQRMSGIEEIDARSGTLTALAGTPLAVIQQAAQDAGWLCGIDLGARGTCTIGGNVSTNAGGNQVIRYGMTRKNVLGLEVVLADGRVLRSLNKMMKNNAGYDWIQWFIGAEGTLGVVTRVVLALHPRPAHIATAVVAVESTDAAIALLRSLERRLGGGVLVFEAMWREFYDIATTTMRISAPLPRGHDLYILIEAASDADSSALQDALEHELTQGRLLDAVVAQSGEERKRLWALRESVYEHARHFGASVGFDVSVPLDRMASAIAAFRTEIVEAFPQAPWVVFGHLADSNVHVNVHPGATDPATTRAVEKVVYAITRRFGGSISAEHGIGRTKRDYLHLSRSDAELELMATMKKALDPGDILNRGRVLPSRPTYPPAFAG